MAGKWGQGRIEVSFLHEEIEARLRRGMYRASAVSQPARSRVAYDLSEHLQRTRGPHRR